jgi:hypothetical protein
MRIFTVAMGCAAIGFLVTSCFDDTNSTGTDVDSVDVIVDNVCRSLIVPFCEAMSACCQMQGDPSDVEFNLCEEGFLHGANSPAPYCWNAADRDRLERALRTGIVVFDQAQFDTCLTGLKSMSAGGAACTWAPTSFLLASCLSAFQGQIAPGEACTWTEFTFESVIPCKDGRCEHGECIPFLKTGDSCDARNPTDVVANKVCNYLREEACRISPPDGGGGGGGAGAEIMGTCGPKGDIGDACYGRNEPQGWRECKSRTCDATAQCILPLPLYSACSIFP